MTPFEYGVESFLTLKYDSPIHALGQHYQRFNKEDKFEFARGFKHAQKTLEC